MIAANVTTTDELKAFYRSMKPYERHILLSRSQGVVQAVIEKVSFGIYLLECLHIDGFESGTIVPLFGESEVVWFLTEHNVIKDGIHAKHYRHNREVSKRNYSGKTRARYRRAPTV